MMDTDGLLVGCPVIDANLLALLGCWQNAEFGPALLGVANVG
jgi:hypothetical protein